MSELLDTQPPTITRILETNPDELLVLSQDELERYIFDELFQRTKVGRIITPEYMLSLQYISRIIADVRTPMEFDTLGMNITQGTYITDAMSQWDYQLAWNRAVSGYVHFVEKRRNSLNKRDYIDLAELCFQKWYELKPKSAWWVIASHVRIILEKILYWKDDMMMRVPWVQGNLAR
jgi:hypothetical protein